MNSENELTDIFSRKWRLLLLRGLAAITFGVLVWFQPGISLTAMVLLFGAYAMADGILGIWIAIAGHGENEHWWILLLEGQVGIGIGILIFWVPGLTELALPFYIAIWAIATGVLEIIAAIRLRKEIKNEWLLIIGGLASLALGTILMAVPTVGVLSLLWVIASYAIGFGIVLVLLAFRVRKFGRQTAGS